MHSSLSSLFSVRTILLIAISVCVARANATIINDSEGLPTFAVLENFSLDGSLGSELDAILFLSERNFVEETIGENEFFLLTAGSESNARQWLAYLAPESLSLDLTLQNATILLQSFNSQPPTNPSPFGVGQLPTLSPQPSAPIPAQVFLGIDLQDINSFPIEPNFGPGSEIAEFTLSEFTSGSTSIPEPTSSLLFLLGVISTLGHRRRHQ